MTPEYVDASDLIQPDNRSDAQKWLDAEMDKRWANEQGAEPFPILESIALEVIEENQRLRAQIWQGEPVAADAERYGKRLNDASLAAVEAWNPEIMGPMTGAIFNNLKGVVRAAILRYCEGHTHPAPQQKPLTDEQDRALCEAYSNAASDEYFKARPQLDSDVNRRIFYAGHRKAWIEWQAAHNIGEKK